MSKETFAEQINKALHSARFAAKDLRDASKRASQMEFIVLGRALQMAGTFGAFHVGMPLVGAAVWRHRKGLPQVQPRPELGYVGNFAWMVLAKDQNDRAERAVRQPIRSQPFFTASTYRQRRSKRIPSRTSASAVVRLPAVFSLRSSSTSMVCLA